MLSRKIFHWTLLLFGLLALSASAQEDHSLWETDFDQAVKKAEETGKDLLVDFSGSDWCVWCKRLDGEVFSQPAFKEWAPEKFVPVLLDFPRTKSVPNAEKNRALMEKYKIQGFPTVLLMDSQGKPYAQTGYMEGGPTAYIPHLELLKEAYGKVKTQVDTLSKAQGEDFLLAMKGFFRFLDTLGSEGLDFSQNFGIAFPDLGKVLARAFEADPDNARGVKLEAAVFLLSMGDADEAVRKAVEELDPKNEGGNLEKLLAMDLESKNPRSPEDAALIVQRVQGFLGDKTFKNKEMEAWAVFMAGYASMEGLNDETKAKEFFERVIALQPEGGRWADNARKMLDRLGSEG